MLDSIIDPFGTATDHLSFLNVEEIINAHPGQDENGITYNIFYLHGKSMI